MLCFIPAVLGLDGSSLRRALRRGRLVVATAGLVVLAACGRSIGDECFANVDCATDGTRQCLDSTQGGYCTIEGCDRGTCPDDALCVRFFPSEFSSKPCSSDAECLPYELCTSDLKCVMRSSEKRYCVQGCESAGDCREGLRCRASGTEGAELIPTAQDLRPAPQRFCFF